MSSHIKALLITIGVLGAIVGYVSLLSIDGMPTWYYASLCLLMPAAVIYAIAYVFITHRKNNEEEDDG